MTNPMQDTNKTISLSPTVSGMAVDYMNNFNNHWYCISSLGDCSGFIHNFMQTIEGFRKLNPNGIVQKLEALKQSELHESKAQLTENEYSIVLDFFKEAQEFQERFLKLVDEPNLVENLIRFKQDIARFNYSHARSIILSNCI